MASEQIRFLQPRALAPRKRWGGCWGGCFRKQKGGKRIVPSRIPEGNAVSNQPNGPQPVGLPQTTGIAPSLYAPPSSPASFSHSALPSTAQSPNCFLSANSPRGPSSTMYVTGPYANEPQLVSPPPLFSTFTTEPSTAPVTPPPELSHLTTPSSPDVPYAHFLSSSTNIKNSGKSSFIHGSDLQSTYSLYPGSPASTLRSPPQWSPKVPSPEPQYTKSGSGRFMGIDTSSASKSRQDSNFFCPETFAQFYLDQSSFSNTGGRLSISRESDAYSNGGTGHQNRQTKVCKLDAEELEAYRASFGFSADEIITTAHYVEISNVQDDSFSMVPLPMDKSSGREGVESGKRREDPTHAEGKHSGTTGSYNSLGDQVPQNRSVDICARSLPSNHILSDDEDIYSKMGACRNGRKYQFGSSNSDAEIEYRRGRSLREERSWRGS